MESCMLCLEINKDILDCIMVNSTQWQKLDIAKTIEKHFWSLNTVLPTSWICSSCWREVDCFHRFYLRVEEAHTNFGKVKIEDCVDTLEYKESTEQDSYVGQNDVEITKNHVAFCFLEPEILIDQAQQRDLTEEEIFIDQPQPHEFEVNNETVIMPLGDKGLGDLANKKEYKRLKLKCEIPSKDPLEKPKKSKKQTAKFKINMHEKSTNRTNVEESNVKKEPTEFNDSSSDKMTDINNDVTDVSNQPEASSSHSVETKKCKDYNKNRISRKENDEFIIKHFKQIFCNICQLPFEDFPTLQKHFTKTHKQRGYLICCQRKFFDRTRLVDHIHCHLNPDHFRCNQCGKAMSERVSYAKHMLLVHRANEVVKQHHCDVCGKSFIKPYKLREHKLTHLSEEEKKFPCSDCGKNYGSSYILKQHREAVHLKRFAKICYICGKAINSNAEFKVHMNKHEGVPLPVNCDVCGLRLTSDRGLKLHKESQHPIGGKQEHHCPFCPKISPTPKALKKHINTMHGKGYSHKCSICEKAFKRMEALREHMATHTGTALYTCPWCPKTFNSNGNMHSHRKKMHPKEWVESKLQKYSNNIPPEI